MLQLHSDADERSTRVEGSVQELEQGRALLEHLEQMLIRLQLLGPNLLEQNRGSTDVQSSFVRLRLGEGRPKRREECPLSVGQLWLGEPLPEQIRAERQPCHTLVQVLARPLCKTGIDGFLERHEPLRHAT